MKHTNVVIRNIGRMVTMEPGKGRVGDLGVIEDAYLLIKDGRIKDFGPNKDCKIKGECEVFDAKGMVVVPGLIDCHTHIVHAGSRQNEFLMRSQGKRYWEIAEAGGGIMSTVKATRQATEDELYDLSLTRINEAFERGITTIEAKSGYGLEIEAEIKILKVINKLNQNHAIDLIPTFLGAHVVPKEYKENREKYIELIINEMLPQVAKQNLAMFCDVFVEDGAFNIGETHRIIKAAKKYKLKIRLHVDQFKDGMGGELASEVSAMSADHLDYVSDSGISAMAKAKVVGVVLPGATFFVGEKHFPPARKMIDKGVKVAISTDYNPGTTPTLDLLLMGTIAGSQMGMTLDEVWQGITINPAISLGIEKEKGSIAKGKKADLVIFNAKDEYFPLYRYATNWVHTVIKDGKIFGIK